MYVYVQLGSLVHLHMHASSDKNGNFTFAVTSVMFVCFSFFQSKPEGGQPSRWLAGLLIGWLAELGWLGRLARPLARSVNKLKIKNNQMI